MKTTLETFSELMSKALWKIRKGFRKTMGKKTIKIDGLQHCKLMLLKAKLNKDSKRNITIGDTIEFLYDYWVIANEKNN